MKNNCLKEGKEINKLSISLEEMQSLDFPQKRSGSSGMSCTQNKWEEESRGAKSKSGKPLVAGPLTSVVSCLGCYTPVLSFDFCQKGQRPLGPVEDPMVSHFSSIFRENYVKKSIPGGTEDEMK